MTTKRRYNIRTYYMYICNNNTTASFVLYLDILIKRFTLNVTVMIDINFWNA